MKILTFILCFLAMNLGVSIGEAAEQRTPSSLSCKIQSTTSFGDLIQLEATASTYETLIDAMADQCFAQLRTNSDEPAESLAAECANLVVGGC